METYSTGSLKQLNEVTWVKCLAKYLAHDKRLIFIFNLGSFFFHFLQSGMRQWVVWMWSNSYVGRRSWLKLLIYSIPHCISHLWTNQVFTRQLPQTQQYTKHGTRSWERQTGLKYGTCTEEGKVSLWQERMSQLITIQLVRCKDDNNLKVGHRRGSN